MQELRAAHNSDLRRLAPWRRPALQLWIAWIITSAIGAAAGWTFAEPLSAAIAEPIARAARESLGVTHVGMLASRGLTTGLTGAAIWGLIGLAHWPVLRSHLRHASWWVPATAAGGALGWGLSWPAGGLAAELSNSLLGYDIGLSGARLIAGAVSWGCASIAQWLLLRRAYPRASRWIVASTLAGTASWHVLRLAAPALGWSLAWGSAGAVWGLGAGAMLVLLASQPRQRPGADTQADAESQC